MKRAGTRNMFSFYLALFAVLMLLINFILYKDLEVMKEREVVLSKENATLKRYKSCVLS